MLDFDAETVKLPCAPVFVYDETLGALVAGMFDVIDYYDGLGLAANQVGSRLAVIVVSCGDFRGAVINPKVGRAWGGTTRAPETCLSAPGQAVKLPRFRRATITGLDMNMKKVTYKTKGILARVFQHEIDHMAGVTIFDRQRLGLYGQPRQKEGVE